MGKQITRLAAMLTIAVGIIGGGVASDLHMVGTAGACAIVATGAFAVLVLI